MDESNVLCVDYEYIIAGLKTQIEQDKVEKDILRKECTKLIDENENLKARIKEIELELNKCHDIIQGIKPFNFESNFLEAAEKGDIDSIRYHIHEDPEIINSVSFFGKHSALYYSIKEHHTVVSQFLILKGCTLSATDFHELFFVQGFQQGDFHIVNQINDFDKIDNNQNFSSLFLSIKCNRFDIAEYLINNEIILKHNECKRNLFSSEQLSFISKHFVTNLHKMGDSAKTEFWFLKSVICGDRSSSRVFLQYEERNQIMLGEKLKMLIHQVAFKKRFRALNSVYYSRVNCAIITYCVSSHKSIADLDSWIIDIRKHSLSNICIIIAGVNINNTIDIMDNLLIRDLVQKYNVFHFYITPNVENDIRNIFNFIYDFYKNKILDFAD